MGEFEVQVNRRQVLAGMVLWGQFRAPAAASRPLHILIVCPAGSVKSAIARESLKRRARDLGLMVEVRSRGIKPEDHVSPVLAARLRADGLDVGAQPLLALSAEDLAWADRVIGFDSAVQAPGMSRAEAWDIPSWNEAYDSAKAVLSQHIDALLKAINGK